MFTLGAIMPNMALRDDIQKRIDRKRAEMAELEAEIRDAKIYVQALEDTLKMLPREERGEGVERSPAPNIRTGSKVDKARQAILKAGQPLHVSQLLSAIGRPNNTGNRAALAGSLSAYARREEIFTRPAPNTFGLLELAESVSKNIAPPPNFGIDEKNNDLEDASSADPAEGIFDNLT